MEYVEKLSKRIKELMDQNNYSRHYLATLAEISENSLNDILTCKAKSPYLVTIQSLAIAFGMSLSEFLNTDELNQTELKHLRKLKVSKKYFNKEKQPLHVSNE